MADPVYLSLWVPDFSSSNMLGVWAKALLQFPASELSPGIRELAVYPFDWSEAPVLEQSFEEGAGVDVAVPLAGEFLHEDYAYEAEINWDVWVPQSPTDGNDVSAAQSLAQWERVPQMVAVACLGPEFDAESGTGHEGINLRPHLLLNLGLDTIFLPDVDDEELLAEALQGVAGNCYRENIAQLLGYLRKLEKSLPLQRRLLWSSSGEDLAARIRSAYGV